MNRITEDSPRLDVIRWVLAMWPAPKPGDEIGPTAERIDRAVGAWERGELVHELHWPDLEAGLAALASPKESDSPRTDKQSENTQSDADNNLPSDSSYKSVDEQNHGDQP